MHSIKERSTDAICACLKTFSFGLISKRWWCDGVQLAPHLQHTNTHTHTLALATLQSFHWKLPASVQPPPRLSSSHHTDFRRLFSSPPAYIFTQTNTIGRDGRLVAPRHHNRPVIPIHPWTANNKINAHSISQGRKPIKLSASHPYRQWYELVGAAARASGRGWEREGGGGLGLWMNWWLDVWK